MIGELDTALRLIVSCLLGGIIGYERESRNKSAGLRTHVLVCVGSCLIMILSENIYYGVQGLTNADPARLAAQVVSGIGFLGAGTIMKEGLSVKGLTTAASLWVVAGVGLAVGFGHFSGALITTGLVFLTLRVLGIDKICHKNKIYNITVQTIYLPEQISRIVSFLGNVGVRIKDLRIQYLDNTNNRVWMLLVIKIPEDVIINEIMTSLLLLENVFEVTENKYETVINPS